MLPDDRPADALVVVIGDSPWHGHRLAAQHLTERLAHRVRVLYVDPPITPAGWRRDRRSEARVHPLGLERLSDDGSLHRLGTLLNPAMTRPGGRRPARALFRHQIRRAVRRLGGPVHAVVQIPVHFPVLGAFDEPHRLHLASDDFVAAAVQNGVDPAWVARVEHEVATTADSVVAVSDALMRKWQAFGFDPVLIPNGCDVDLYATTDTVPPADDVTLEPPIAGFIGTLSDRTDADLLWRLAERGTSVLLVGPRSRSAPNPGLDRVFDHPRVQWVGARPYTEVPRYVRHMHVGLVPYRSTAFNEASFPLKTLDYLAAGRPVVGTDLPAMRAFPAESVVAAHDADEFVTAVEELLRRPVDQAAVDARRRLAREEHSWEARVDELARVLGLPER